MSWLAFLLLFRDTFRKERSLTYQNIVKQHLQGRKSVGDEATSPATTAPASTTDLHHGDLEKAKENTPAVPVPQIELTLKDVSPFSPIGAVLRRINNLAILVASGKLKLLSVLKLIFFSPSYIKALCMRLLS